MKLLVSVATAIVALSWIGPAAAKTMRDDYLDSAFSDLTAYANASANLFVAEARCRTGNEKGIRESVHKNASAYVRPDKLEQFVERSFDVEIKRLSLNPYEEPCKLDYLSDYRRYAPTFLARAKAEFTAAHYPD